MPDRAPRRQTKTTVVSRSIVSAFDARRSSSMCRAPAIRHASYSYGSRTSMSWISPRSNAARTSSASTSMSSAWKAWAIAPRRLRPWAARLRPGPRLVRHEPVSLARPRAQQRPRVARIDDLLDAEALGRAERRAHRVEPRLDLLAQCHGVVGRLELAPVRRLEPARDRQRAPVARRPRVPQVQPRRVAVRGARDAVDLADQHRHPRHGRLVDREQGSGTAPHRAGTLGLGADHEPRLVDEVDHREPELVA